MKIGDYILNEDVFKLTDEEFESFRTYLKLLGYHMNDHCGLKTELWKGKTTPLVLDCDTDLIWSKNNNENRITLEEVRKMAELGSFHESK